MNDQDSESEQSKLDVLTIDVPDETIEAAACTGTDNLKSFTVTMCTGQSECPF
jgi:hypothetical protein